MKRTNPLKRNLRISILAAASVIMLMQPAGNAFATGDSNASAAFEPQLTGSFAGALLAAQSAANQDDLTNAIAYFRRALQFSPDDISTNDQLFIALAFNGDLEGAAAQSEKISGGPRLEPLSNLVNGLNALNHGDYDQAVEHFKAYDGSDLDTLISALLEAWALAGDGKTDQALSNLDALSGPPWYALFKNYNSGAIAAFAGETDRARGYFNNAVVDREGGATSPDTMLRTAIALATLEQQVGNQRKALDSISVAETYGINDAILNPLREKIEAGEPLSGEVGSAVDGASGVLFQLASALSQGGGDDIIALYLSLANTLTPDEPDILYLRGTLAIRDQDPERALNYFSRIGSDAPQYRLAELQRGLVLADLDRLEEAETQLETLVEDMPDDRRGYLALSAVYSGQKKFEDMARVLDEAVEMIGPVPAREDWSIFYRRGIAYERLKEWEKAEPNFKKALELFPNQPQVLNYLGYSWIDQGIHLDEGLDLIQQAVDQNPDDGYIVDSLGWAYYRLGRFPDAVAELERAAQLDTADPTINDHLGDAYWQVGRKLEAIYQWNKALALEPPEEDVAAIEDKIANGLPEESDDASSLAEAPEGDGNPDAGSTP